MTRRTVLPLILVTAQAVGPLVPGIASSMERPAAGQAVSCGDPMLAVLRPPGFLPDRPPSDGPYGGLGAYDVRGTLGVGYLASDPSNFDWEWHRHVRLPLFREPDTTTPFAWVAEGWLVDLSDGSVEPFDTMGLVETHYESSSAIVTEIRRTGWIRFRYLPDSDATAWTHDCFLAGGETAVAVTTWEERFLSDEISPLYFLRDARHALRAQPRRDAEPLAWIPASAGAYHLEPLEVRNDWMRVRLVQPSDSCVGPDGPPTSVIEGWVTWRDDESGPWVWYHTRGC